MKKDAGGGTPITNYLANDADDTTTGRLTADGGFETISTNPANATYELICCEYEVDIGGLSDTGSKRTGMCNKFHFTAGTNAVYLGDYYGFDSDIKLDSTGAILSQPTVYAFKSLIDATSTTKLNTSPLLFQFQNPKSDQAFANGYFRVEVAGGENTEVVAGWTQATAGSGTSASSIGYKGYASSEQYSTGGIIGVQGYALQAANSDYDYSVAVDGVGTVGSSNTTPAKRMGVRCGGHMFVRVGSVIVASGGTILKTPSQVPTDHLDFSANTGELYVQETAEFDGPVYFDHNEHSSHSAYTGSITAGTKTILMVDGGSTGETVTLPPAADSDCRRYIIKRINGTGGIVTVAGDGSELIDGLNTKNLAAQYDFIEVVCDGTQWWVIG